MSIRDIQLLEAVTRMQEIARYVESEFGKGSISIAVRGAADDLYELVKKELHREQTYENVVS